MRIRAHVVWLVAAAVLPVMIFSTVMTVVFWRQQRAAFEDRFLERVRAVSIALDREHIASISALRGLASSTGLSEGDLDLDLFVSRAEQSLLSEPSWSAVMLLDAQGTVLRHVPGSGQTTGPSLRGQEAVRQAIATRQPVLSGLVTSVGRERFATWIAVPAEHEGQVRYVVLAETDQESWLGFLSRYPVVPGATMTLLDQNRVIIARTLNNDRWVGRAPAPGLVEKVVESPLGSYRSLGLEGQWFYSAHSRAPRSGWTVATGVPIEYVEASLRGSLIAMLLGITGTGALAILLIVVFGRRIERPVRRLAALARSLGSLEAEHPKAPISKVREVDEVAETLVETSALVRRRSAERDEALAKETAARAEAESANRSKDEFLAMLGHELRNPLGAISSAAVILEHPDLSPTAAAQAREIIARQVAHLVGIVDDLLDVARVNTGKIGLRREIADVAAVVARALDTLRTAGKLEEHEVALDATPVLAEIDVTRIEQVVTNLLTNALKYTPGGGAITIRVGPDGDDAALEVRDTGIGITSRMLPYIFDLFVQSDRALDRAQGGLGIGLTLVRRIVELHGGSVQAASGGPGQGSTFTVRLPRTAHASLPAASSMRPPGSDSRQILVVEDNDDAREMLATMLRLWGHHVDEARDTGDALAGLEHTAVDVALVDIGLPGRDGYELARELRRTERGRGIFLVAVTGYGQPEDHGKAIEAGFDGHLVKPVDPEQLAALLSALPRR
jgi:signal transduction histidine kinase